MRPKAATIVWRCAKRSKDHDIFVGCNKAKGTQETTTKRVSRPRFISSSSHGEVKDGTLVIKGLLCCVPLLSGRKSIYHIPASQEEWKRPSGLSLRRRRARLVFVAAAAAFMGCTWDDKVLASSSTFYGARSVISDNLGSSQFPKVYDSDLRNQIRLSSKNMILFRIFLPKLLI